MRRGGKAKRERDMRLWREKHLRFVHDSVGDELENADNAELNKLSTSHLIVELLANHGLLEVLTVGEDESEDSACERTNC